MKNHRVKHTNQAQWMSPKILDAMKCWDRHKSLCNIVGIDGYTVERQWFEHWWLVYHGCFEFVLESLGKTSQSGRFIIIWGDFLFFYKNGILCVHIRIASMRRFYWEHTIYLHVKETQKYIPIMPSDLTLWLTLISSNYPCLELISLVPKVFEPLKFDCDFMRNKVTKLIQNVKETYGSRSLHVVWKGLIFVPCIWK